MKGGIPLYSDSHHIAYTAAKAYAEQFVWRK
jgi:hypothetical protein